MENWQLFSQTLQLQKTASDHAFDFMTSVQKSSRDMLVRTLESFPAISSGTKSEWLFFWADTCLLTMNQCRFLLDQGYDEAVRLFGASGCKEAPAMEKFEERQAELTLAPLSAGPIAESLPERSPVPLAEVQQTEVAEETVAPSTVGRMPETLAGQESPAHDLVVPAVEELVMERAVAVVAKPPAAAEKTVVTARKKPVVKKPSQVVAADGEKAGKTAARVKKATPGGH